MFDFLETVELWDAEGEIDRLVGNPWELHDSTQYKLRLLPLRPFGFTAAYVPLTMTIEPADVFTPWLLDRLAAARQTLPAGQH